MARAQFSVNAWES